MACPMTMKNKSENGSSTKCFSTTSTWATCSDLPSEITPRKSSIWAPASATGQLTVCFTPIPYHGGSRKQTDTAVVAQKYPSARVIGNDISPIQPVLVPPNLEIRVEDIEDLRPWTSVYANSDLIHMRSVLQTLRDPRKVLMRVFECVLPSLPHPFPTTTNQYFRHPETLRQEDG